MRRVFFRMRPFLRPFSLSEDKRRARSAPRFLPLLELLLLAVLLSGCGLLKAENTAPQAQSVDPGFDPAWQGTPLPYALRIEVRDGPGTLADKMKAVSQLEQLVKEPPDSMLALERRARADVESAVKLLHSQCYYDGTASFALDENARPVKVTLTLVPGPLYVVGRAAVRYEPAPVVPEAFMNRRRETGFWGLESESLPPPSFPANLPGVERGKPVTADAMLAAVEALPEQLRREGYPLATVAASRYSLDRPARLLNADIVIRPGPPALMGRIEVRGAKEVNAAYLQRLTPWIPGAEPWDEDLLEEYANTLRGLGLFRSVQTSPLEKDLVQTENTDGAAVLPVEVSVAEAPFRSLSGSARYDTDTGLGVEGVWEHRNLFHNGEKLKLTAPIATEIQGLKAAFEKPAFLMREQRLLASASALREDTSAYLKMAGNASVGLDRRLSRRWWGAVSLFGESGSIKDNEHEAKAYGFLGPQVSVRRDSRNNILNPSDGSEVEIKLKPFSGFYEDAFNVMAGSVAASLYYAPFRDKGLPDDKVVLAGRVEAGGMVGAPLRDIPANLRYYAGGAGSVRGYAYQALGPRDSEDDPLGGRSYQIVNLEARFKVTEHIGLVPFVDGGMVYRDELPRILGDMDWAAGLGLRYYTPIGPVRLDVAVPMQHIEGDPPVQIYVSIGQSF